MMGPFEKMSSGPAIGRQSPASFLPATALPAAQRVQPGATRPTQAVDSGNLDLRLPLPRSRSQPFAARAVDAAVRRVATAAVLDGEASALEEWRKIPRPERCAICLALIPHWLHQLEEQRRVVNDWLAISSLVHNPPCGGRQGALVWSRASAPLADPARAGLHDGLVTPRADRSPRLCYRIVAGRLHRPR
jgi:hypothetical protein